MPLIQPELPGQIEEGSADPKQMLAIDSYQILDRLSNPFFSLDRRGCINYLNKKAEDFFRCSPDALIGRKIDEISTYSLNWSICGVYYRSMAEQKSICLQTYCGNQDLWFEHHIHPAEDGLSVYIMDITERKRGEIEQLQKNEQLLNSFALMEGIREEEKSSLAREIHDELGQQLTALIMDISWLDKHLGKEEEGSRKKIIDILGLLDTTVETIRKISTTLHPGILDDLGLTATLEWQSREFEKRFGIPVQFQFQETGLSIPSNVAICLFRIYQESLTNIARHADARKVIATLDWKEEGIFLYVIDNGRGFDMETARHKERYGLTGMKERATLLGGRCEITSESGKGTSIKVCIPTPKTTNISL